MRIENPELEALLTAMPLHERRIAELFAQALGEDHVLAVIKHRLAKKDKEGEQPK
ncbi:MAG: hypothetical protein PHG91_09790 [Syntrophales bacterium]|nr:hypothetical protein [Syntrophales bacterium]MDD5233674.1 hypothetical protein [Syntrophales bacterium]MDD5531887.1 hypothetical protein [Syntrophales bacterium]HPL63904.1 hypothetical protein [Syntrophales bacterium]